VAKKRVGNSPKTFRQMAVDQLRSVTTLWHSRRSRHQSTAVVYVARDA
jgi:hypothetical protein